MGVSLYVMPIRTWLTGAYAPSWEGAGRAVAAPRLLSDEDADAYLARVQRAVGSAWEDAGPPLAAVAMSYEGFSRASAWAGHVGARHLSDPLQPFWLPVDFDAPREVPDPRGGEEPLLALSAPALRREIEAVVRLREGEVEPSIRALLDVAALSERRRVPVVLEG